MKITYLIQLFCLCLCLQSCDKSPVITSEPLEEFVDQGTSVYADSDPTNDVMLQSFWWDTYTDNRVSNSFYSFFQNQIIELSNAHIDVVWLPPSSEGEGMGYHPRKLFDFNSNHGSEAELTSLLETIKSREMHGMADLVFNHRIGTANWNDFTEPAWPCNSICVDDEGFTNPEAFGTLPCGDLDEGESWGGARDLNHQSEEVLSGLKEYLEKLKDLGFDSWRYDFVKGFPAKYVGEYNSSTPYYISVGEYWDGNSSSIKSWIEQTGETVSGEATRASTAFDFDLKYKLQNAIVNNNYSVLKTAQSNTVGLAGIQGYNVKSVTFLDNHDTGCINRDDCDNLFSKSADKITQGYLYLLTHPGIPMIWGYHYFFYDTSGTFKEDINDFILIRKRLGISASSEVEVLETVDGSAGYYVAMIDNKLIVKIGPGDYSPDDNWTSAKSGTDFNVWELK